MPADNEEVPAVASLPRPEPSKSKTDCFDNIVILPEESHHLDCFELNHIATQTRLIPSSPMSKTNTFAMLLPSSRKRARAPANSSGTADSLEPRSEWSGPDRMAYEAHAVANILDVLYDETVAVEEQPLGSSNNNSLRHPKEDLSPTIVLVAAKANGIYFKRLIKVLLDSGSTSNFIYEVFAKSMQTQKSPNRLGCFIAKWNSNSQPNGNIG